MLGLKSMLRAHCSWAFRIVWVSLQRHQEWVIIEGRVRDQEGLVHANKKKEWKRSKENRTHCMLRRSHRRMDVSFAVAKTVPLKKARAKGHMAWERTKWLTTSDPSTVAQLSIYFWWGLHRHAWNSRSAVLGSFADDTIWINEMR